MYVQSTKSELLLENFEEKQERILTQAINISNEYQRLWEMLAEDYKLLSTLILQQTFLSDRFSEYHAIWKGIVAGGCWDSEQGTTLYVANQKILKINPVVLSYERKTQRAHLILKSLTASLQEKLSSLQDVIKQSINANSLEQLKDFNSEEFTEFPVIAPYPDIQLLNKEWSDMDLHLKLDTYFQDLQKCRM